MRSAIGKSMQRLSLRIADDGLGILASGDGFQIAQEALAQHDDAAIARAQVLLRPIRDRSLANPCDEILIHHVA